MITCKENYLQIGEIEDIRLVTNYKGKSKGYAYVQFKDEVRVSVLLICIMCRQNVFCCIIWEAGAKLCRVQI